MRDFDQEAKELIRENELRKLIKIAEDAIANDLQYPPSRQDYIAENLKLIAGYKAEARAISRARMDRAIPLHKDPPEFEPMPPSWLDRLFARLFG